MPTCEMVEHYCTECGIEFLMPKWLHSHCTRYDRPHVYYCPQGHEMGGGPSRDERIIAALRGQLRRLRNKVKGA